MKRWIDLATDLQYVSEQINRAKCRSVRLVSEHRVQTKSAGTRKCIILHIELASRAVENCEITSYRSPSHRVITPLKFGIQNLITSVAMADDDDSSPGVSFAFRVHHTCCQCLQMWTSKKL